MFSMLLWCLPQSMLLLDLAGSQSTCLPLSKLPGAPVGKLELNASGPRELPGLFILHQCSFFLPEKRHLSFFYCFPSYSLA